MGTIWKFLVSSIYLFITCRSFGYSKTETFYELPHTITCDNSTVLHIRDASVRVEKTPCQIQECGLKFSDVNLIKDKCDNSISCTLDFNLSASCFYRDVNFTYICSDNLACTFEQTLCGWSQEDSGDDFDWMFGNETTETRGTGPTADHTTSLGYYIYIESNGNHKKKAQLKSNLIRSSDKKCLIFWYFMHGQHIGSLIVLTKQGNISDKVWHEQGNQEKQWLKATVEIQNTGDYEIIIEGVVGNGHKGDIAIDDIDLFDGHCGVGRPIEHTCLSITDKYFGDCLPYYVDINTNFKYDTYECANEAEEIARKIVEFCKKINEPDQCDFSIVQFVDDHGCFILNRTLYVEYECKEVPYIYCNFENRLEDCDVEITPLYNNKWTVQKGDTAWDNRPQKDHTTDSENGSYILFYVKNVAQGYTTSVITNISDTADKKCFSVWYYIFGDTIGSLNIYGVNDDNHKSLFRKIFKATQEMWKPVLIDIHKVKQIILEYQFNSSTTATIALDDICVSNDPCDVFGTCNRMNQFLQGTTVDDVESSTAAYSAVITDVFAESQRQRSNNSAGVIAGVVIAVCIVVVICVIIVIFIRRRSLSANEKTNHNIDGRNSDDYMGNQNIALSTTNLHVETVKTKNNYNDFESRYDDEKYTEIKDVGFQQEATGTKHDYIDIIPEHSFAEQKTDLAQPQQNEIGYTCLDPAETGFNRMKATKHELEKANSSEKNTGLFTNSDTLDESKIDTTTSHPVTPENYTILDPQETGFDRSKYPEQRASPYELAKPIQNHENDPYFLSKEGEYDSTSNIRHKETDESVYSHSVENFYDSARFTRDKDGKDDTYDHFFGQKTEDDYDISKST